MDPLRLSALGGTVVSATTPALVIPKAQPGNVQGATGASGTQNLVQSLAQDLFLRTLQATNPLTGAEQAAPAGTDLAAGLAPSLLAALTAPSAAVAATATADTTSAATAATTPTTTTASGLATALPATPALATPDLTATAAQAEIPDSSSLAFALETALRFGAGVGPGAGPALALPDLGASLVRDAAAVPRLGNLQPQTGRPGPEAFTPPQVAVPQAVNAYRTSAVAEPPAGLDLLA